MHETLDQWPMHAGRMGRGDAKALHRRRAIKKEYKSGVKGCSKAVDFGA